MIPEPMCGQYNLHSPHRYEAMNSREYDCAGFTEEDEEALRFIAEQPPCEHGLSQHLCDGPDHYAPERDEEYF